MKASYIKLFLNIFVVFSLFACKDLIKKLGPGNNPTGVSPIRVLSIQMQENQEDELINKISKFSEKHQLEISVTYYTNQKVDDTFLILVNGRDFHVTAYKSSYTQRLDINFIPNDPNTPPSQEVINELYNDLKTFLTEIHDLEIIEK